MKIKLRKYLFTWIILIALLASLTMLLILALSKSLNPSLKTFFAFGTWIIAIAAAIFFFLTASKLSVLEENQRKENEERGKTNFKEKRPLEKSEIEQLDVQGIAKKLVRRITPTDKPEKWGKQLLSMLEGEIEIMAGIFYSKNKDNIFSSSASFAYPHATEPYTFKEGEGLTGQVVKNRQPVVYRSIPDEYTAVFSGLGSGKPSYLAIVPILAGDDPIAVFEIAGFRYADDKLEQLFQILSREISEKINESKNESKESSEKDSSSE